MRLWGFLSENQDYLIFQSYQHLSMVAQCLVVATVIAVVLAALVYRSDRWTALATSSSAVGLTIPSFALIGILVALLSSGVAPAVVTITFFAILPILRNAVVGLAQVDQSTIEAARGMGLSRLEILRRVELPLAWPVILTGVRISGQLTMGIAAIAAYVNGPGLGALIFQGLARIGGENAREAAFVGTVAIILLALVLDLALKFLGRATTSRGIRV